MEQFINKIQILSFTKNTNLNSRFKKDLQNKILNKSETQYMLSFKHNKLAFVPPLIIAAVFAVGSLFLGFAGNLTGVTLDDTNMPAMESNKSIPDYNAGASPSVGMMNKQTVTDILPMPPYYPGSNRVSESPNRYYDTDAGITIEAAKVGEAALKVKSALEGMGAILDNFSISESEKSKYDYAYLTFNVKQEDVANTLAAVNAMGYKVTAQNYYTKDVTVNIEDQQKQTNETVEYYQKLINQLQDELNDEKTTEARKNQINTLIDSYNKTIQNAQDKMHDTETTKLYATLTVYVAEAPTLWDTLTGKVFGTGYINDLFRSGGVALAIVFALLRLVGHLIIWFVVFGIVWMPVYLIIKNKRGKKVAKPVQK